MEHCRVCGTELELKYLEGEGMVPWCRKCEAFRFPQYNVAVSVILYDPDRRKILLIKQYGRDRNILVAGYVNKGESAEHALHREVMEEIGLEVSSCRFNCSEYYEKSNTLMLNFAAFAKEETLEKITAEVDSAAWYLPEEAKKAIAPASLAEKFLLTWLGKCEG